MKLIFLMVIALSVGTVFAQNIDPANDSSKYAYGENVGWLNFKPSQGSGVTVTDTEVSGYVWAENIGWINLKPANGYGGVINNGIGELSGYAWGENVGWINFDPYVPGETSANNYRVCIDHDGNFTGWAWGENIGWIHFNSSPPVAYKVKTSWITSCHVDLNDLRLFCMDWLSSSPYSQADFYKTPISAPIVDFKDFSVLASYWTDYCPYGWPWRD